MTRLFAIVVFMCIASTGALSQAKVRVVTTIPDFGALAEEVGGECVQVQALVKPTQDPHYVDPRPSLMVSLNRADLLLVTGMELEAGWLPPLLTGARNSGIQRGGRGYLDCSTVIPPMEVQAVDRAQGDIHPGGNPHYWIDPRNGLRIAQAIAERLAALDSSKRCDYQANLRAFEGRLKSKIEEWNRRLAPHQGTKVVVYHRSWVYFLDWIGFVRAGSLEPKPGIPPKPSHVAELIGRVQGEGVQYVIQESFYPSRLSQIFARKSGAQLKVLPTMVGAAGTKSYMDLIEHLVTELTGVEEEN